MILSCYQSFGQKMLEKATISRTRWGDENRPSSFYDKKVKEGDFGQDSKMNNWWIVASDRSENPCYVSSSSSSGKRKNQMDLMETAAIIEIENGFAHLIQENESGRISSRWPKIPSNAKDLGWILLENLLLFPRARTNENLIYEKAMVLTTIDANIKDSNFELSHTVDFKKDPELQLKANKSSNTFEIYFIYKKVNSSVLLGKSDFLSLSDQDKGNILGWVPASSVTFWNQRNCLEPNSKPDAVADFKQKGVLEWSIFGSEAIDLNETRNFAKTGVISNSKRRVKHRPFPNKRPGGYEMRNPIIEQVDNFTYKVGTIGSVSNNLKAEMDAEELKKKIAEYNEKMSNVNIVFVIDGTQSMGSFYKPVSDALSSSIKKLRNSGNGNVFKFGAVIYRDYPDGGKVAEVKKLTADYTEVTSFLNEVKLSGDKDYPEAMFQGIEKGLKDCGMRRGQSNFIFLIGDAGNHLQDKRGLTESTIIKEMAEYKCNLVAFQVNNDYDPAFDDFIEQAKNIIKGTAVEIATAYGGNPNLCTFKSDGNNKHELSKLEDDMVDIPYMVGSFIFPTKGSSMPVQTLEKEIEQKIIEFDKRVVLVKNILETSTNLNSEGFTDNIEVILRKSGLTERDINKLKRLGIIIKVEGYLTTRVSGCDSSMFLPVLFLSRIELNQIVEKLGYIDIPSNNDAESRIYFRNGIIDLVRAQIGALNSDKILSMTMEEIYNMTMGIPFRSSALKNIPITDICDPNVVSPRDFSDYVSTVKQKRSELRKIYSGSTYECTFSANGQDFFWLPLEDMP
jgi:hypothetical protein